MSQVSFVLLCYQKGFVLWSCRTKCSTLSRICNVFVKVAYELQTLHPVQYWCQDLPKKISAKLHLEKNIYGRFSVFLLNKFIKCIKEFFLLFYNKIFCWSQNLERQLEKWEKVPVHLSDGLQIGAFERVHLKTRVTIWQRKINL